MSCVINKVLKTGEERKLSLPISEYNFPDYMIKNIKVRIVTNGLWSNIIEIKKQQVKEAK